MKDKGRKYDLSYLIKHGGSNRWIKVPFKSRNKGKKSELKEKAGFFNKGSSGLTGLSKLAAGPSFKKSNKLQKAQRAAAEKIAKHLEDQFSSGLKAPGLFQKQEERRKIEKKKVRIERKILDEASQRNAETFMQAMRSGEYNQEELLKNFCRISNPGIKESIIISAFIPKFLQNINEIKTSLQEQGNLDKLSDNYYSLESSYRKTFDLFMRLQGNVFTIASFKISLTNLLLNMGLDIRVLSELIDNIIKNGFNFEMSEALTLWIDNFKKVGRNIYNIDANTLNKDFVFEEDTERIEDILGKFLIRKILLGIKEELDSKTVNKLYQRIVFNTARDKVIQDIGSIKKILTGEGTLNRFIQKYEIGYFSEEQVNQIMKLLQILSEKLKSINDKVKSFEEEFFNKDKEKEVTADLEERFKNTSNVSQKEKEKEITKGLEEFRSERNVMYESLKKNAEKDSDELFRELAEAMTLIYEEAQKKLGSDYEKLKEYLTIVDKQQQSGGDRRKKAKVSTKKSANSANVSTSVRKNANANIKPSAWSSERPLSKTIRNKLEVNARAAEAKAAVNAAAIAAAEAKAAVNARAAAESMPSIWKSKVPLSKKIRNKLEANTIAKAAANARAKAAANARVNAAVNARGNEVEIEVETQPPSINQELKSRILNQQNRKQQKSQNPNDTSALAVMDFETIFKKCYNILFSPLEYLISKYVDILTTYSTLMDEFKINDRLYFDIEIYSRLKSNDTRNYSSTAAFIFYKILNIEEIMSHGDENINLEDLFIKSFNDYCRNTVFTDDTSVHYNTGRLQQLVRQVLVAPASLLRLTTGSASSGLNITKFNEAAAEARQRNHNAKVAREQQRKQEEEKQKSNEVNRLFAELKKLSENNSNRELTPAALKKIKPIKESLNKILNTIATENRTNEREFLKKITNQIRGLEMKASKDEVKDLEEMLNETNPNTLNTAEIEYRITKLKNIKRNVLVEANINKVNTYQRKLEAILQSKKNAVDYPARKAEYDEKKVIFLNLYKDKLENTTQLNISNISSIIPKIEEILEVITFLINIAPSETNKQKLKSDSKYFYDQLKLFKIKEKEKLKEIENKSKPLRNQQELAEEKEQGKKRLRHIKKVYTTLQQRLLANNEFENNNIDSSLERLEKYKVRNIALLKPKDIEEIDNIIKELQKIQKPKAKATTKTQKKLSNGINSNNIMYDSNGDEDDEEIIYKDIQQDAGIFLSEAFINILYNLRPKTKTNRLVSFLKNNAKNNFEKDTDEEEPEEKVKEKIRTDLFKIMQNIFESQPKVDSVIHRYDSELKRLTTELSSIGISDEKIRKRKRAEITIKKRERNTFVEDITMQAQDFFTNLIYLINKKYKRQILEKRTNSAKTKYIIYLK